MIEFRNIYKSFGKLEVLHGINFSLRKGEITALLGTNGAGKTTIMNILAGILIPDQGQIILNDKDITDRQTEIKKIVGYLPENNPLYGDMYVSEYLEFVARLYLPSKTAKSKVEEMIESIDLKEEYRKKINTLSHGNKQRVGLAQAFIHDPKILILDEPTNGLDPAQQLKINTLIQKLGESKILIFSSHHLNDVADIASRYLVLKSGQIILDESASKVDSIKEYFYTEIQ